MASLKLSDQVTKVPLIGPSYAQKLNRLDIHSVEDLLHHYPARHIDRSQITPISELIEGEVQTIIATVDQFKNIYTRTGKNLQQAVVSDDSGSLQITWFNQKFLANAIKEGESYAFSGKTKEYRGHLTLTAPEFEKTAPSPEPRAPNPLSLHTGRLVPIYPETAGLSSKWLRSRIKHTLKLATIPDHHTPDFLDRNHLISLTDTLKQIHFPDSPDSLKLAKSRLAFDELFFLQLEGAYKRNLWEQKQVRNPIKLNQSQIDKFIDSLPFKLTTAQSQAVKDILGDLQKSRPMNRLLEGDVGSGKTVVAAISAYANHLSGHKTFFMAPTEILAVQHYQELGKLFQNTDLRIALITGKSKPKSDYDLAVGTQALLHLKQSFSDLGLVIIDEQHRFGVSQRRQLESLGNNPHRLTMSATPIPRTVALTLYGDLDLSIIDEMPKGRKAVKTWVVPSSKRKGAYTWIREQIKDNQAQVFVVCPLIDPSEADKLKEVKSATAEYQKLQKIYPKLDISLLHGRLKSAEKDSIIKSFKDKKADILVATPVIEVGIDIPNANIILIEAAERFGLAQLHQLRGRVGRGDRQSYCLLFTSTGQTSSKRLQAMTRHNSGFKLAEIDLKIRGPGEVFGVDQHGFDTLKYASLSNQSLITATKSAAQEIINNNPTLKSHPQFKSKISSLTSQKITLN